MTNSPTSDSTSHESRLRHALLVPGFWLGGWAWEKVEPPLNLAGITTHPVTLPGLDGRNADGITLGNHIDYVIGLINDLEGDVVLVGHSGGAAVVQGVIDREPKRVSRIIYIDSGPLLNGIALMPDATIDVALPTWDELAAQNSSIDGIDDEALNRFRQQAVDEPAGVARSKIRVTDQRRHEVPASVICTSIDSETLVQMIESGDIPSELGAVQDVQFIDLPTGHWPMFSRPEDLAAILCIEINR